MLYEMKEAADDRIVDGFYGLEREAQSRFLGPTFCSLGCPLRTFNHRQIATAGDTRELTKGLARDRHRSDRYALANTGWLGTFLRQRHWEDCPRIDDRPGSWCSAKRPMRSWIAW